MSIFDNLFKKQVVELPKPIDKEEVFSLSYQTDLPKIIERKTIDYVEWGENNMYPKYLSDMYLTSPTHNAIVKTKAEAVVGEGYEYNSDHLDEADKIDVIKLLKQYEKWNYDLSLDYQIYGAFAIEVIWSLDFKKIVHINRLEVACLRSGKYVDGKIKEWYWKNNWNDRRENEICIKAFDLSNKRDHRQILYVSNQSVSNKYYPEPSYIGALEWISLESQVGLYYKSLIENGFNPSIIIKFFRKPGSLEEKAEIVGGLKRSFAGVKNSGKHMVLFSDGKELAPEVQAIDVSNVDKQFTVIAEQITQKILTGERATTPELFGLAVPGQLGSGDFDTKVRCFTKFVIVPDQRRIETTINKILEVNGFLVDFKLKPFMV